MALSILIWWPLAFALVGAVASPRWTPRIVLGGALIALGLLVPVGAALVIAVMTTAARTAHRGKGPWAQNGGWELPLVNATAAFALAAVGAGQISLDHALGIHMAGTGWALGALGVGILGGLGAIAQGRLAGRAQST